MAILFGVTVTLYILGVPYDTRFMSVFMVVTAPIVACLLWYFPREERAVVV